MSNFPQTLRHYVSIEQRTAGRDAAGQPLPDAWAELRKEWADIRTTGGLEAIRAGAVTSTVNASIRLRFCEDLDASMRVVYGATVYQVLSVLPDAGRVYVDLLCEVTK